MSKKKQNEPAVWGYLWRGQDEFVPGLPARDISLEEAERNGWIETLEAAAVYERAFEESSNDGD